MNTCLIDVKDQFGTQYSIIATLLTSKLNLGILNENIQFITVNAEEIRPSIDMYFQSLDSNKIFKIV
ncbi:hypothetical protein [Acinetobacter equi]|uniref:Uncharacterized protein n=1 Tax=Acinetobacter equi TaxID=1324350 RepID=A0A0N9VWZ1_9GAMM|nr:hypothetical protein [Acinetobacter equi]ALH95720.1 hypothetical protein AOY20_09365 [Acinetobacter equi]